jgi:alpha-galactosidase/6-phospho-beta-glucosidase family protein
MTVELIQGTKEYARYHARKHYWKNQARSLKLHKTYRKKYPNKIKAACRKYYYTHQALCLQRKREYDKKHRKEVCQKAKLYRLQHLTRYREYDRRRQEELSDAVVRHELSKRSSLRPTDWPQPIVEVKRCHLLLRRKLHELSR